MSEHTERVTDLDGQQREALITDAMVDAALAVVRRDGEVPYMARVSDFTDEEVAGGELKRADDLAEDRNRAWVRRALWAALTVRGEAQRCSMCHGLGWVLDCNDLGKPGPRMVEMLPCLIPDCAASGQPIQSVNFPSSRFQSVARHPSEGFVMSVSGPGAAAREANEPSVDTEQPDVKTLPERLDELGDELGAVARCLEVDVVMGAKNETSLRDTERPTIIPGNYPETRKLMEMMREDTERPDGLSTRAMMIELGAALHIIEDHATRVPIKQHDRSVAEQREVEGFTWAMTEARKALRQYEQWSAAVVQDTERPDGKILDLGGPEGGRYWRVLSGHAVDDPLVRDAAVTARVTGSVGCLVNGAKVERAVRDTEQEPELQEAKERIAELAQERDAWVLNSDAGRDGLAILEENRKELQEARKRIAELEANWAAYGAGGARREQELEQELETSEEQLQEALDLLERSVPGAAMPYEPIRFRRDAEAILARHGRLAEEQK